MTDQLQQTPNQWYAQDRLGGLRRFAIAITVLNVLGHSWFGFEQSLAQPFAGIFTAYAVELLLEWLDARVHGRPARYRGGIRQFVDFLLPGHITGLAVAMLLYPGDRIMPIVFAATVAIASKNTLRVTLNGRSRHCYNPSNLGIATTLLCFPWVGIAPPYHFTENLTGIGNWILPGIIICSGTLLNTYFTRRLPLIATWLTVFIAQACVRSVLFDTPLTAGLMPMSGVAFLLFTFYMVTDPPTTPSGTRGQMAFGASVAVIYGLLMTAQIVFGLFFALALVSTFRAAYLYSLASRTGESAALVPAFEPAAANATVPSAPHSAIAKPRGKHTPVSKAVKGVDV